MPFGEEFELLAAFEVIAFPATIETFLNATVPDPAMWRTSSITAGVLAAKFHQSAQNLIAGRIILKDIEERNIGKRLSGFVEPRLPKLFS